MDTLSLKKLNDGQCTESPRVLSLIFFSLPKDLSERMLREMNQMVAKDLMMSVSSNENVTQSLPLTQVFAQGPNFFILQRHMNLLIY